MNPILISFIRFLFWITNKLRRAIYCIYNQFNIRTFSSFLLIYIFLFLITSCRSECPKCVGSGEMSCHKCLGTNLEDCSYCYGTGKKECTTCNGNGKVNCSKCSGNGSYYGYDYGYNGSTYDYFYGNHPCSNCSRSGKVNCNQCYSSGKINCTYCGADGKNSCTACYGKLKETCGLCLGKGDVETEVLESYYHEDTTSKKVIIPNEVSENEEPIPIKEDNILSRYDFSKTERVDFDSKDVIMYFFKALNSQDYNFAYDLTWIERFEKKGKDWFTSCEAYGCTTEVEVYSLELIKSDGNIEEYKVSYYSNDKKNGNKKWEQVFSIGIKGEERQKFIINIKNQNVQ